MKLKTTTTIARDLKVGDLISFRSEMPHERILREVTDLDYRTGAEGQMTRVRVGFASERYQYCEPHNTFDVVVGVEG